MDENDLLEKAVANQSWIELQMTGYILCFRTKTKGSGIP